MTVVFNTQTGTFPDVVYHPVFGARTMRDANEVVVLGPDWFNTAEEADLHRTQAEAERASAQHRRVGRMPTAQNTTRSAARDVAKRERQRLERSATTTPASGNQLDTRNSPPGLTGHSSLPDPSVAVWVGNCFPSP